MTATIEISTIIRARLDEGRAIADEDVLRLLAERDALQARCEEAERECAHQQGRADRNAKRRKGMTITTEAEEFTRLARLWSETFVSAIRSLAAERDALRAENARMRKALRPFIQTGTVQGGYRVKLNGQEPPPITASEEEAWAHYGGSDFHYQQWLQWRAVQIGRELLGETQ